MSQGAVVRKRLSVQGDSSRALDERVALRLRRLLPVYLQLVFRLPVASRIRQALLWRANRLVYEAFNRHDFEALLVAADPDTEFHVPPQLVELGIGPPRCRGVAEYVRFLNAWFSAWDGLQVWPRELIDLGDRQLMLGETAGRGKGSGTPVTHPYASINIFKHGRLVRHHGYFDHAEALEAVGLSEQDAHADSS
jgi:ketosteroid isomerase-like protein